MSKKDSRFELPPLPRAPATPPPTGALVAGAVYKLADQLEKGLPLLAATTPLVLATVAAQDLNKSLELLYPIPVSCGGQWDAYFEVVGTETERDYPGGDNADQVSQTAIRLATEEAEAAVKARFELYARRVVCEKGCQVVKVPTAVKITFDSPKIEASYGPFFASIDYKASVRAVGRQTFKCVRRP